MRYKEILFDESFNMIDRYYNNNEFSFETLLRMREKKMWRADIHWILL
jgi:hypothetical protein